MTTREEIQELIAQREQIEAEAKALHDYLTAPGMPGLKGGLIDKDMFPIAGLDHYQIRESRHRLAILNTDYKTISDKIEKGLHVVLAGKGPLIVPSSTSTPKPSTSKPALTGDDSSIPFARVATVEPSSPAEESGLRPEDLIVQFGAANHENHNGLKYLGEITLGNLDKPVDVIVQRGEGERVSLVLTPHTWSGRGLLGCFIVPL